MSANAVLKTILFKNVCVIDVVSDQPRCGVSILVEGVETIDLSGKAVLPGLIDAHVHTVMMDDECLPF